MLVDGRETQMSAEQNAALVRRYFEECVSGASGPEQRHAVALVDDLMTADFAMYYNNDTDAQAMRGRELHKEFLVDHAQSFPDDHWTIEALIADVDTAVCLWRIQSRHAKTGNAIDVRAADFYRFRDGRLAEMRRFLDFKSLGRQTRPSDGKR
jgi:ketosteroid isomerase-like protein